MADNRIYLRCTECGEILWLGKRLVGGYYWYDFAKENNREHADDPNWKPQEEIPLEKRLNDFYDRHEWCGHSLDHYDIVYENDEDFFQKVRKEWIQQEETK